MIKPLLNQVFRENRFLLTLVLLACVVCGTIWYAACWQQAVLERNQALWSAKRRQVASLNATQAGEQYRLKGEQITTLLASVPYAHEFPNVISQILDFMALNSVVSGPMTFKPNKSELDGVASYTLKCSANGNYASLKRLIADLERLDGISTLDSVSFTSLDVTPGKVELELLLTIYLREASL